MPDLFLHGIETVEIDDGIRPIQTVKSSVIGFVGTAPAAEADTKASLTLGNAPGALLFTAKPVGTLGNAISVHLRNPGTASAALGVVVTGNEIVVNLATSASSVHRFVFATRSARNCDSPMVTGPNRVCSLNGASVSTPESLSPFCREHATVSRSAPSSKPPSCASGRSRRA